MWSSVDKSLSALQRWRNVVPTAVDNGCGQMCRNHFAPARIFALDARRFSRDFSAIARTIGACAEAS